MKKTVTFLLVCVLLLGLCSCGNKTPGPGDTISQDDIDVTFIGIETVDNPSISPAEGKIFVLCEFEIANNTGKAFGVSTLMSFQAYCDEYACDLSLGALMEKGNKAQLDGTIADGNKLQGVVGFEIPENWQKLEIHYTPNVANASKFIFAANNDN